jgi:NitT/TauT family transport system ATP-binding protein
MATLGLKRQNGAEENASMAVRGVEIEVRDLTHRYTNKSPITFENVNFKAEPGEAIAIIGRSGCGKSTLLHIIAGLLAPTSGTVKINGEQVVKTSPRWVMMFQAPHLFPWMKVSQNVGVGLRFAGWPKEKIEKRVAEVLELVELQDFAENSVLDLSGGQQQRVALARSLVMEPEVLLLDEPFSALDAFTRAALRRDVRSIAKQLGFNLLLVTHDIDEAVIMADRALIMAGKPGRIYDELEIDLPDPRERDDPAVQKMRQRLMTAFHKAVETASRADGQVSDSGEEDESAHDNGTAEPVTKKKSGSKARVIPAARPGE